MTAVLIQADDISGCAGYDTCFARRGRATPGSRLGGEPELSRPAPPSTSRLWHRLPRPPPREARGSRDATGVFASCPASAQAGVLFKRMDSLWRGNVGAAVGPDRPRVHTWSLRARCPQLGSTVVGGRPLWAACPWPGPGSGRRKRLRRRPAWRTWWSERCSGGPLPRCFRRTRPVRCPPARLRGGRPRPWWPMPKTRPTWRPLWTRLSRLEGVRRRLAVALLGSGGIAALARCLATRSRRSGRAREPDAYPAESRVRRGGPPGPPGEGAEAGPSGPSWSWSVPPPGRTEPVAGARSRAFRPRRAPPEALPHPGEQTQAVRRRGDARRPGTRLP